MILKEPIKNEKGYIKFIGELDGRTGTYFGIHLDVIDLIIEE
jgi:dynactin complex subunit